jgi:hypothetical protein
MNAEAGLVDLTQRRGDFLGEPICEGVGNRSWTRMDADAGLVDLTQRRGDFWGFLALNPLPSHQSFGALCFFAPLR